MIADVYAYLAAIAMTLVSLFVLLQILMRTEKQLRTGYLVLTCAFAIFGGFLAVSYMDAVDLVHVEPAGNVLLVGFAGVSAAALWFMERVIRGITDRGQVMVALSTKDHFSRLVSSVKNLRGKVFYVSLMDSCDGSKTILGRAGVDVRNFHFVGLTGEGGKDSGFEVIADARKLCAHLLSEVGEKDFDFLVVDDMARLQTDYMELEAWVSQITAKAREAKTQSLYFVNKDTIPPDIMKDLGMFMDNVVS